MMCSIRRLQNVFFKKDFLCDVNIALVVAYNFCYQQQFFKLVNWMSTFLNLKSDLFLIVTSSTLL